MSFTKWLKGVFNDPTPEKELEEIAAVNKKQLDSKQNERNLQIIKDSEKMSFSDTVDFLKTQYILNAFIKANEECIVKYEDEKYDYTKNAIIVSEETFRGCTIKRELFTDKNGNKFPSNRIYIFFYKEGRNPKNFDDLPCMKFNSCNI